jgi:organic hydroperoxide reductase OsmC/OhrA
VERFGSAAWNSGLPEGKARSRPRVVRWKSGKPGTNPEELLGAAHAVCFKAWAAQRINAIGKSPNHGDWRCRL